MALANSICKKYVSHCKIFPKSNSFGTKAKKKLRKENTSKTCVCENESLCCKTSNKSFNEQTEATCLREMDAYENQSICYNTSDESNDETIRDGTCRWGREEYDSVYEDYCACLGASESKMGMKVDRCLCGRQRNDSVHENESVCQNASEVSEVSTRDDDCQCGRREKNDSVHGNQSVCCHNASEESMMSITDDKCRCQRPPVETICYNIPSNLDVFVEELLAECSREETISEVERESLSKGESNQTFLFTNQSLDRDTKNYSMSHDVKSDSFAEEQLRQLPRKVHADESRGHWEMMLHCERAAFPRTPSNLPLPSREARFYWHLYSTAAKRSLSYQKQVNQALLITLVKIIGAQSRKKGLSFWDQLIQPRTFDRIGRKNLVNQLERLIRKQTSLESICLEGLSLTVDEGVRLLLALYNSRKTMKYVYCWRAFEKMVSLSDTDRCVESRFYADKNLKICDWFRAIGCLEFLTTLSVNYGYIATPTGDLLINLAKKLGPRWQWLQLLCLEEEIVQKDAFGKHGVTIVIPDTAWRKAHFFAPMLKVQYAIIGIPEFDVHKKLFTKSTRVHTMALSTSIDLRYRQPWYLDCTLKTLFHWYSNTLVYLCLQVWHNRENLDIQLRKLFLHLPSLEVFEFIGEIRTLKTLCVMCCQLRSCCCNVRDVNMQLQEVLHDDIDKEKWVKSVKYLTVCFKEDFDRMGIKFDISFYCC